MAAAFGVADVEGEGGPCADKVDAELSTTIEDELEALPLPQAAMRLAKPTATSRS